MFKMLNFKVDGNTTAVTASGTHRSMIDEAIMLEAELHRFVYSLGVVEYTVFLQALAKLTSSDKFFDFLESNPDEETRISMPNLNREGETDG